MRSSASVYVIFFLSGVAGLGYEIAWTRMFAVGLGHEMPSMLAVVAAFFIGIALGAWGLDRVISRSARPGRWYAALELVIAAWAAGTILLIPVLNRFAAQLIGVDPSPVRHWLVAFAVPCVGLLPATAAMGATLPAMERLLSRLRGGGRSVAGLYGVNTAGAVAGTLGTTFIIIPVAGYRPAILLLVAFNVLCAIGTLLGPAAGEAERPEVDVRFEDAPGRLRLHATIFLTGLLGIGYEVLAVRVMAQVLENTVYSFASALSIYLFGTAVGAAVYHRLARRWSFEVPLLWLLQMLALTCMIGIVVLEQSLTIYEAVRGALGAGQAASVAAEMTLALAVFLLPTACMGATFSHLAQAARGSAGGVGRALGLNTIGSSLAPLAFGVVLLPLIGARWALLIVAAGYLLLAIGLPLQPVRAVPGFAAILMYLLVPAHLVLVEPPPGGRTLAYREGVMAASAVVETGNGHRLLKVNNRFNMGGTAGAFAERRQAHIPLLLHPDPQSVLFLGVGTGITAAAATAHPDVDVTGVELVPEVIDLVPWFHGERRGGGRHLPRWVIADARRFVRASDERFDVIVADLFHPARDGAGSLYTVEHFTAVRERLREGGLFCQWLPVHQLESDLLKVIVRTFLEVFPDATGWICHFNIETPMLGLVGTTRPLAIDPAEDELARTPTLRTALEETALSDRLDLLGCLVAAPGELAAFSSGAELNTDEDPIVIFRAPAYTYGGERDAGGRLQRLLADWAPEPSTIFRRPDEPLATRVRAYIAARNLYIDSEVRHEAGDEDGTIEALVQAVRTSRDFETAYVAALQFALNHYESEPDIARELLRSLRDARPDDARAARQLLQLFGE